MAQNLENVNSYNNKADLTYVTPTIYCLGSCSTASPTPTCAPGIVCDYIPTPMPKAPPCDSYGDLDNDGFVTMQDYEMAKEALSGTITLTPEQLRRADVDGSGQLDDNDLGLIDAYRAGQITTFPVCNTLSPTLPITRTPTPCYGLTPNCIPPTPITGIPSGQPLPSQNPISQSPVPSEAVTPTTEVTPIASPSPTQTPIPEKRKNIFEIIRDMILKIIQSILQVILQLLNMFSFK